MRYRFAVAASLLCVSTASFAADKARDFNVVVANNFTSSGSDVEGWVAAGGDISVGGYSIGLKNPATAGHYAAIAGGNFIGNYGDVHGDTLAASYTGNYSWVDGGAAKTYGGNNTTINVASELIRLGQLSADLAANPATYGTVGTTQTTYGQLFLVGADTRLNIFNVTASDWATYTVGGLHIATATGSLSVINIAGATPQTSYAGSDSGTYNGQSVGFAPQAFDSRRVIYNFYQATNVTPLGSINATVLAIGADFTSSYGVVQGQIFAKSFSGHIQVNHQPFRDFADGTNLLDSTFGGNAGGGGGGSNAGAVPEPAAWALMLGGFGLLGAASRRRRTFAVAA